MPPIVREALADHARRELPNDGLWQGRPYLIYSVAGDELAAWTIADGEIVPLALG